MPSKERKSYLDKSGPSKAALQRRSMIKDKLFSFDDDEQEIPLFPKAPATRQRSSSLGRLANAPVTRQRSSSLGRLATTLKKKLSGGDDDGSSDESSLEDEGRPHRRAQADGDIHTNKQNDDDDYDDEDDDESSVEGEYEYELPAEEPPKRRMSLSLFNRSNNDEQQRPQAPRRQSSFGALRGTRSCEGLGEMRQSLRKSKSNTQLQQQPKVPTRRMSPKVRTRRMSFGMLRASRSSEGLETMRRSVVQNSLSNEEGGEEELSVMDRALNRVKQRRETKELRRSSSADGALEAMRRAMEKEEQEKKAKKLGLFQSGLGLLESLYEA